MSDLLQLKATTARPELWVSVEPQVVYLHVVGQTTMTDSPRTPLNLCLAIDRSSSMRGERLYQVKEAARHLVNQLGPGDTFALIAFNDRAEVLVPASTGAEHSALHQAISALEARGGTEMAQGLALGLQEVERTGQQTLDRLILLTDGRTYGDEHTCIELARRAQQHGIGLTAFGVGTEWNEDLLETMTGGENGRTQYITSVGEIVPVFEAELTRMRNTFARRVEMIVAAHPQAVLRNVHRVEPFIASLAGQELGPGRWQIGIGEWAAGMEHQWLLEVVLPACGAGQQLFAKLELHYETLGAAPTQLATRMAITAMACAQPRGAVDPDVRHVVERITAYRLQLDAWQAVSEGRLADATQRLEQAGTHLFNAGEVALGQLAQVEATRLLKSGAPSADGRKRIKYGTRRLIANGNG